MSVRAAGWALGMAAVLVLSATVSYTAAQDKEKPSKPAKKRPFKPISTVEQIMEGQQMIFGQVRDGIRDQKWPQAVTAAHVLAELANVNVHHAKDDTYARYAGEMAKKSAALATTLMKHDSEQAQAALSAVSNTCKTCHDAYRKKRG